MSAPALRRRLVEPVLGVLLALLSGQSIRAHEPGATRVSVLFPEGRTYRVEIVTDAAALVEKLDASAGRPSLPADADPARLESVLAGSDDAFRQRVKVMFNAVAVPPSIEYSVAPAIDAFSAPAATIRLTGPVPPGARRFTWNFAWTFASYALTIPGASSNDPTTEWLEGGQDSAPLALPSPAADRLATAWRYLRLGFTRIVPMGPDHILFVLGIVLLSGRARPMLWQVGAFTVAHSITLGLSIYGLVEVSPTLVGPLIAVSIAYVAIENLLVAELRSWRIALVFVFGLLHGLRFADAFRQLGPQRSDLALALSTFNVGVEAGQFAVIAAAFVLFGSQWTRREWYRSRLVVPVSAMIACAAVYWTIERLSA